MKKLTALLLCICLVLGLAACGPAGDQPGQTPSAAPAQTPSPAPEPAPEPVADPTGDNCRVFYQIFVGSFSDSDGDGVGDLRGIINRLDYLNDGNINSGKSLGVQGLWLSPIFASPSYHKYDTTNYYAIDEKFGTEEDLKELLELCHQRNVKVILDLVINHTSKLHPWFTKFAEAHANGDTASEYYDYYSWATLDGRTAGLAYSAVPGSGAAAWYECNFSTDMPELNYDNEAVRQAMLDVARYYLDLGVDGFRFDAVKYIYMGETSRSVDFWRWYMDELRAIKPDIYCVGECWSGEGEILEYCAAMNCFNFTAAQAEGQLAAAAKGGNINNYTGYMCAYQNKASAANPAGMPVIFIANHDMDRAAGYLTVASGAAKMGASLLLLGPGSPFIYYGEEIGMKGTRGGANTDANRRLGMLWGDGDTVKDPEGTTYLKSKQTNGTVASQLEDENSLLEHYRKLISIRVKYPAIGRGEYTQLSLGDGKVGGFSVSHEGSTIGIIHNVDPENERTVAWTGSPPFTELCEVIGQGEASFDGTTLTIGAQTTVILR